MRDPQVFEEVPQAQQLGGHGAKRPPLLVPLALGIQSTGADKHVPLMHVQARTSFIHAQPAERPRMAVSKLLG